MSFDFPLLYAIQTTRTDFLDKLMLAVTRVAGNYGQIWIILALLLCVFKKSRRAGITMLISYVLVYLVGNVALKNLITRPRPFLLDETVTLLVEAPTSYSFPSTHAAWAFAAAASVFAWHKWAGTVCILAAFLIAFSRLYLFVHFPTDVFAGILLGIFMGVIAWLLVHSISAKPAKKGKK